MRVLLIYSPCLLPAHCCRCGGRRPVAVEPGLVSRGLPNDAVHRVQRRTRHMSLLRQQVQLLADDDQLSRPVHDSGISDAQGRKSAYGRQSLQRLHEGSTTGQLPPSITTDDVIGLQLQRERRPSWGTMALGGQQC